jgi:hypothetical protein
MALEINRAAGRAMRHVVARARGRRVLYADAASRAAAARRLAEACARHGLACVVWSVTDRCLHFVLRGDAGASALAAEELAGARLRFGTSLATLVNADLYLLELARHALVAPVRARFVRRATDWPHSSARETCGLCPAAAWLDPGPLYDLLGPRDGQGPARFRRFLEVA